MIEIFKTGIQNLALDNLLSYFFATIGMFVAFIYFIKKQLTEESRYIASNILDNEASINTYAKDLKKEVKPDTFFYKEYLRSTLVLVEKYLGELKLFSFKTWEKHFTYSLIYSIFFFYLIWLFGGSGTIGTLNFFPNENRLTVSLFLIFGTPILYFTIHKTKLVVTFLSKHILLFSNLNNTWKKIFVVGVGIGIAIAGILGIAGIGGTIIGAIELMIVALGVGGIIPAIVLGAFILVATSIDLEQKGANQTTILFIFFSLILPFINSIFDYLSMYFSRLFAYKILHTHKKWKVFVDIIVDTFIAIALLVALATTLFYVLEYANGFIDDEKLKIPVEFYKTVFLANPFSQDILWITLMFASTLIPTIAHLVMGLYSLLALYVVKPHLEKLADELIDLNKDDTYSKHRIAGELVRHEQSLILKAYMFIGIGILFGFLLSAIALLLKIGFNII